MSTRTCKDTLTAEQRLAFLAASVDQLQADLGGLQSPWGDINRFQRNNGDIVQRFDDTKPSTQVMFCSSDWGSLAAFEAQAYPGAKKWYGTSGNSFVAVIEFGDPLEAKAVTAGGLNSVPGSKHFNDLAERYATGALARCLFLSRPTSRPKRADLQAGRVTRSRRCRDRSSHGRDVAVDLKD